MSKKIHTSLDVIIEQYQKSFADKVYNDENNDHDLLMDLFGITPELKRENRQYWGRELGMCWQKIVTEICRHSGDFGHAFRIGADELCDLTVGNIAIDTKYRVGSGDSGTLKKFKSYGRLPKKRGFTPVLLIVREDNLPAAITACSEGGWEIYTGDDTFDYILDLSGFYAKKYLQNQVGKYQIGR